MVPIARGVNERIKIISTFPSYSAAPPPRYIPTQTRANILCILLLANAATSVASLLLSALELALPGDMFADGFEDNPVMLVLALLAVGLAVIQIVIFIATVVVFLMWLYRAHENLTAFGVPKNQLEYSSGWAVGSFFVPIVSLIIPYRAVREVWRKSVPHQTSMFGALDPPSYFPLWWGLWIVSNIIDRIYFRLSWREDAASDALAILGIVSGVLGIVSALLAVQVVREIQRQQVESSKTIPTQQPFAPPPAPPQFNQYGNIDTPPSYNS